MKALEEKAKNNELTLKDTENATFTLANLGSFNVDSFVPIVNAPQSCILGVGAAETNVVVDDKTKGFKYVYCSS